MSLLPLHSSQSTVTKEELFYTRAGRLIYLHPVFIAIIWLIFCYFTYDIDDRHHDAYQPLHIILILPLPYALFIFAGLLLNYKRNSPPPNAVSGPLFTSGGQSPSGGLDNDKGDESSGSAPMLKRKQQLKQATVRKFDRLFLCCVTKGVNKEAVGRTWEKLRTLQSAERGVFVYVLSDDPYYFDDMNNIVVPSTFQCQYAIAKARALEYFRIHKRLTQTDWVLHLDEVYALINHN
jgi:hypothetical protein